MNIELVDNLVAALPEMLFTIVIGFQVFLFQQISEARREHLKLQVEIARNHPSHADFERAMDKLESNLSAKLDIYFSSHYPRT